MWLYLYLLKLQCTGLARTAVHAAVFVHQMKDSSDTEPMLSAWVKNLKKCGWESLWIHFLPFNSGGLGLPWVLGICCPNSVWRKLPCSCQKVIKAPSEPGNVYPQLTGWVHPEGICSISKYLSAWGMRQTRKLSTSAWVVGGTWIKWYKNKIKWRKITQQDPT